MVLRSILRRFLEQRPVAVMVRAILENQFADDFFDHTFEAVAPQQSTRAVLFATCARWLAQVSLGPAPAVPAAFVPERATIAVSVASRYEKLQHVAPRACEEPVQRSPAALAGIIGRLHRRAEPIAGLRLRILDGNVRAGSEPRVQERRGTSEANRQMPLPHGSMTLKGLG